MDHSWNTLKNPFWDWPRWTPPSEVGTFLRECFPFLMNGRRSEHWSGLNRKAVLHCDSPQNTQTHCVTLCDTPQNTATHCSCCSSLIALCCVLHCVLREVVLYDTVWCERLAEHKAWLAANTGGSSLPLHGVEPADGKSANNCLKQLVKITCSPLDDSVAERKRKTRVRGWEQRNRRNRIKKKNRRNTRNRRKKEKQEETEEKRGTGGKRRNRRNSTAPASHSFFFSPLLFLLISLTTAKLTCNTASTSLLFL